MTMTRYFSLVTVFVVACAAHSMADGLNGSVVFSGDNYNPAKTYQQDLKPTPTPGRAVKQSASATGDNNGDGVIDAADLIATEDFEARQQAIVRLLGINPVATPTPIPTSTGTPNPTPTNFPSPTPGPGTPTPTPAPHTPLPTDTPVPTDPNETPNPSPTSTPTTTPTPTPIPSPTPDDEEPTPVPPPTPF